MTQESEHQLRTLQQAAREDGDVRTIIGSRSVLLDDPRSAVVILSGSIELFLAETAGDGVTGHRHHIFTAPAGSILFGMDCTTALQPVSPLIVGHIGTSIATVTMERVRQWAADAALQPMLVEGVDTWVEQLSLALSHNILPPPPIDAVFSPGESIQVSRGQRVACDQAVGWVRADAPAALFLDTEDVDSAGDGIVFPICRTTTLSFYDAVTLDSSATRDALDNSVAWDALASLHRVALDVLPINLRLSAVDEFNRLRSRKEADAAARVEAWEQLAAPLASHSRRSPVEGLPEEGDPLVQAIAAVLAIQGVALRVPQRRDGEGEPTTTIDNIARENQLRLRPLQLEQGWWESDVGAFLLIREGDAAPLAVRPRARRNGYEIYDPVEGTLSLMSRAAADLLRGEAWMFYVPLPARPLGGADVGGRTFAWSRGDVAAILGLGTLSSLLALAMPIATTFIVDSVIPSFDLPHLIQTGLMLVLLAFTIFALRFGAQIAAVRIEGRSGGRLQAAVLDRMLRLPATFFRSYVSGDLTKRILTIQVIERAVSAGTIASLLSGGFVLVSLLLMAYYSVTLTLVALLLMGVTAALIVSLGFLRIRRERAVIATGGQVAGIMLQLAMAIAKLRLAAAEDRAFLKWARLQARYTRERFGAERIEKLAAVTTMAMVPLSTAVLFFAIGWFGLAGTQAAPRLQIGQLLGFITAFNQALAGISGVARTYVQLAALRPTYAYAAPILEQSPIVNERKVHPGILSGAVELSHVSFRYSDDSPLIFEDLSLSIEPGELVAIVGPSGTGKSTLLRLLVGFETPTAGTLLYDGRSLDSLDVEQVRRQLGVVLQGSKLFPGTLRANILGGQLTLADDAAWAAAEQVGLADDIRAMPMGLETVISDTGGALSGGQVQRVLIARAIVGRPRLLLLDEATSALDNRTQSIVTNSLDKLNVTRIVIAHRLSTVESADRIIVIDGGRVVETGRYQELMKMGGLFCELASRQLT